MEGFGSSPVVAGLAGLTRPTSRMYGMYTGAMDRASAMQDKEDTRSLLAKILDPTGGSVQDQVVTPEPEPYEAPPIGQSSIRSSVAAGLSGESSAPSLFSGPTDDQGRFGLDGAELDVPRPQAAPQSPQAQGDLTSRQLMALALGLAGTGGMNPSQALQLATGITGREEDRTATSARDRVIHGYNEARDRAQMTHQGQLQDDSQQFQLDLEDRRIKREERDHDLKERELGIKERDSNSTAAWRDRLSQAQAGYYQARAEAERIAAVVKGDPRSANIDDVRQLIQTLEAGIETNREGLYTSDSLGLGGGLDLSVEARRQMEDDLRGSEEILRELKEYVATYASRMNVDPSASAMSHKRTAPVAAPTHRFDPASGRVIPAG